MWNTAHPHLLRASQELGETFNLAVLEKNQVLYIDRVKTQSILTINLEIGSKLPAYCTSTGRVLLAWLPWGIYKDENSPVNQDARGLSDSED